MTDRSSRLIDSEVSNTAHVGLEHHRDNVAGHAGGEPVRLYLSARGTQRFALFGAVRRVGSGASCVQLNHEPHAIAAQLRDDVR
jgi:hypothetical protein